jgi:ferredoxin--NADP+ reductase
MYKIVLKEELRPTLTRIRVEAPLVAKRAMPGQFIIFRVDKKGERVPLTINGYAREKGTVDIIFQTTGATTMKLNALNEGDYLEDFVGPLGNPTQIEGLKKVAVVGGGVGCAIAFPVAKELYDNGCEVHAITGFKNEDLVILEKEFDESSTKHIVCTDDGSYGKKGLVTEILKDLIDDGNEYDEVIAIGPMPMMKFVCKTTEPYGIKTIVSLSPLMVDGTGMCGCCRVSIGGEMKFACVDGPDFDGSLVDWDLAINRSKIYDNFEKHKREESCNLLNAEVR